MQVQAHMAQTRAIARYTTCKRGGARVQRRHARALPAVRAQQEGSEASQSSSESSESSDSSSSASSESSASSAGAKSAKSGKSGKAGKKKEDDEPSGPVPRGSMFAGPQPVAPLNQDSGIGMLETPVTSSPFIASYLSALPAYRTGVSPLLRGVEIGLAHGFFLPGPFIKLGPLRNTPKAEIAGTLSGMGVVAILAACLAMYGAVSFQEEEPLGRKTLTGREVSKDPLQSEEGWQRFTAGFTFGGFSGALFCYILTFLLPFYR